MAQRGDIEYTFEDNSFLKSFRAGVRATQKDAITRQTGWNWGILSQAQWGAAAPMPSISTSSAHPQIRRLDQAEYFEGDNFFPRQYRRFLPPAGFRLLRLRPIMSRPISICKARAPSIGMAAADGRQL